MENIYSVFTTTKDINALIHGRSDLQHNLHKNLEFLSEFVLFSNGESCQKEIVDFWCESMQSIAIQCMSNGENITKEDIYFLIQICLSAYDYFINTKSLDPCLSVLGNKDIVFYYDFWPIENYPKREKINRKENPCFSINENFIPCSITKAATFIFEMISLQKEDSNIKNLFGEIKTENNEENVKEAKQYLYIRKIFQKITEKTVPCALTMPNDFKKEEKTNEELIIASRLYGVDLWQENVNLEIVDFEKHYSGVPNKLNSEVPAFIFDSLNKGKEIGKEWLKTIFEQSTDTIIEENAIINKDKMPHASIGLLKNDLVKVPTKETDLINIPEKNEKLCVALYSLLGILLFDSYDLEKLAKVCNCAVCGFFVDQIFYLFPEVKQKSIDIVQDEISQLIVSSKDFLVYIKECNKEAIRKAFQQFAADKNYKSIVTMLDKKFVAKIVADLPVNRIEIIQATYESMITSYATAVFGLMDHDEFIDNVAPFFLKYPNEAKSIIQTMNHNEIMHLLSVAEVESVCPDTVDLLKTIISTFPQYGDLGEDNKKETFQILWPEDKESKEEMSIAESNYSDKCYESNVGFFCYTCGFYGDKCICPYCASTCHKGHDLVPAWNDSKKCVCTHSTQNKTVVDPNAIIPFVIKLAKANVTKNRRKEKISLGSVNWLNMSISIDSNNTIEVMNSENSPVFGGEYAEEFSCQLDDFDSFILRQVTNILEFCKVLPDNNYLLAFGSLLKIIAPDLSLLNEKCVPILINQLSANEIDKNNFALVGLHSIFNLDYMNGEEMSVREIIEIEDDFIHEAKWSLTDKNVLAVLTNNTFRLINTTDKSEIKSMSFGKYLVSFDSFMYKGVQYFVIGTYEGSVYLINCSNFTYKETKASDINVVVSVYEGLVMFSTASLMEIITIEEFVVNEKPEFLTNDIPYGQLKIIGYDKESDVYLFQRPIDGAIITMKNDMNAMTSFFTIPAIKDEGLNILENEMYCYVILPPLDKYKHYRFISNEGGIASLSREMPQIERIDPKLWIKYNASTDIKVSSDIMHDCSFVLEGKNPLVIQPYQLPYTLYFTPNSNDNFISGFRFSFGKKGLDKIPLKIECEGQVLKIDQTKERLYCIGLKELKSGSRKITICGCNPIFIDKVDVFVSTKERKLVADPIDNIIEKLICSITPQSANAIQLTEETKRKAIDFICNSKSDKRSDFIEKCINHVFKLYNTDAMSLINELVTKDGFVSNQSGAEFVIAAFMTN